MCSLNALLTERRLRWLGHVRIMDAGRIPKDLLYGELVKVHRKTGRPKLRFKNTCKRDLIKCSINPNRWECQAEDRSAWRVAVRQGTMCAEAECNETAAQKRAMRKQRSQQPSAFKCPNCGRDCHPPDRISQSLTAVQSDYPIKLRTIVSQDGRMPTTTVFHF